MRSHMIWFGEEPIQASLKGKRLDEFVSTLLMHETGSTKYDREMAISCLVLLDHPTQHPVNRKIWAQQSTKEYTQICGTLNIGIFALNLKGKRNSLCFQISWWNSPEMHKYIDRERLESGERLNSKILLPLWWYYAAAASKKKKYSKGQPALSCNFCVLYKNQTGKQKS